MTWKQQTRMLAWLCVSLAIFIVSLGLFMLANLANVNRVKTNYTELHRRVTEIERIQNESN